MVTDENGCSKEFGPYIIEILVVSVKDLKFVNSFQVYPIPAFENVVFSVELNEALNTQMRIIDAFGQVILSRKFDLKNIHIQMDVTNISSGVYYIEFGTENTRSLERFVVVR